MADSPLTEQQLRFAEEYAAEPNATQAYKRAFGDVAYNTAKTEGCKLLTNPNVQAEVQAARRAWSNKCRVSFSEVVRKLAAIAFADPLDLYEPDPENCGLPKPRPWCQIPARARKNIVSVKIKRRKLKGADDCLYEVEELDYKMLDPMAALNKLCEYLGVTKGSLTVDELRNILNPAAALPPNAAANGGPETLPCGTPAADELEPDE